MSELPFGQGQFGVWGIITTEREHNAGLRSTQQRISQEIEIYRTDDEAEARRLVAEGGFERKGVFYATTRFANANAAAQKDAVQSASGVLKRNDPAFKR